MKEKCSLYTPEHVKKLVHEYMNNGLGVGAALAIIDHGVTTFYTFGNRSVDSDEKITEDDIFEIGSITKVFTTITLLALVDQGLVCLDDPIDVYLPPTVKTPQRNGKKITLRQLAMHTSGLPRLPNNLHPKNIENPYADYTVQRLYEFLNSYELTRDPGSAEEYSNLGMGLLGHILSLVSGISYEELIKKTICKPLGMDATVIHLTPAMKKRFIPGHCALKRVSAWDGGVLEGAGFLRSTIKDMSKFLAANMGLGQSSLIKICSLSHEPQAGAANKGMHGFGWSILKTDSCHTIIWHNGETGGFHSSIAFDVQRQYGFVLLTNSTDQFPSKLINRLFDSEHEDHSGVGNVKNDACNSPEYLQQFTGTFVFTGTQLKDLAFPREITCVMHKKMLVAVGIAQLIPVTEGRFNFNNVPSEYGVHFVIDEHHKIIAMECLEPGRTFMFKKARA